MGHEKLKLYNTYHLHNLVYAMSSKKKEPTSSKINFLMQFSLLDFQMNDTCEGMNFTHLTKLMLLHYLVKVKTLKMHVNTTSAFNVNYEIAITCIKLH